MKLRLFVILGATATLGLVACTSSETGGGGGGGGDATTAETTSDTTATTADTTTTTSETTATGAGGGGDDCAHCADAVSDPSIDPSMLCTDNGPPSSEDLYNGIADCICGEAGACAEKCAASVCAGADPDTDCITCVTTPGAEGCGDQYAACSGDVGG
jgi:hypothetical protein